MESGNGLIAVLSLIFMFVMMVLPILMMVFTMLLAGAAIAFWIWIIVDCATHEPAEDKDRMMWILIVILANWIGGLVYYFVRRPKRLEQYGK
ncbi:MAG: PLDc N-terminal domain-containing protein [Lentisphaeria bacterium]|nr:PLDc N-terminal domain-containing protein [Lentisphaeria bacterium]